MTAVSIAFWALRRAHSGHAGTDPGAARGRLVADVAGIRQAACLLFAMKRFGLLAFFFIVLGMTGCDHTTKFLISDRLPLGHSRPIIAGVLDFRHTLNTDTAFSLLGGIIPNAQRLLMLRMLAWVAVAILVSVIIARWKTAGSWERASWALVLSGALGNAIDRLIRGPVVDFIDVHYWPVFNVADISVSVGLGLLLLIRRDWLLGEPKHTETPTP